MAKYYDLVTITRLNRAGLLECLTGFSPKDEVIRSGRVLTGGEHARLVGESSRMIEKIMSDGGTKEDIIDSIKYGLCMIDAKKYGLDIADAQLKFRYQELYSKYIAKETKATG